MEGRRRSKSLLVGFVFLQLVDSEQANARSVKNVVSLESLSVLIAGRPFSVRTKAQEILEIPPRKIGV